MVSAQFSMLRFLLGSGLGLTAFGSCVGPVGAQGVERVGSWQISSQTGGGGTPMKIAWMHDEPPFQLALYCIKAWSHWQVFVAFNANNADPGDGPLKPVKFTYAIDGGQPVSIIGAGWPRYRVDIDAEPTVKDNNANDLVRALLLAKNQLSFSIGPTTKMKKIKLRETKAALTPLIDDCPL